MRHGRIRPIALCLFRHDSRILVGHAYDTVEQDHYCRPLGGGIEFGERGAGAIMREIWEELGAEIEAFTAEWKTCSLAAGPVRPVLRGLAAFLRELSV